MDGKVVRQIWSGIRMWGRQCWSSSALCFFYHSFKSNDFFYYILSFYRIWNILHMIFVLSSCNQRLLLASCKGYINNRLYLNHTLGHLKSSCACVLRVSAFIVCFVLLGAHVVLTDICAKAGSRSDDFILPS